MSDLVSVFVLHAVVTQLKDLSEIQIYRLYVELIYICIGYFLSTHLHERS